MFVLCFGLAAFPSAPFAQSEGDNWWEKVRMEGDLRLRHETVWRSPGEDTERQRYRGRLGVRVDLMESLEFTARLATGEGDPASTNLDFGESLSLDNIRVDRAYLSWSANEVLQLRAGKMANPFFRAGDNALIWDGDINPEGIAAAFESGTFFARAGGILLDYRDDGAESWVYAGQFGTGYALTDAASLTVGMGWFDYTDIAGRSPLYDDDAQGNTTDADGNYVHDFNVLELFAELELTAGQWPLVAFVQWANNRRAPAANVAYAVGLSLGKAEEPGTSEWSWEWRDTEADALLGVLTDSDLADGRTDSRGHSFKGTYVLTSLVSIGATLAFSEYGVTSSPTDFDRFMLDFEFSF